MKILHLALLVLVALLLVGFGPFQQQGSPPAEPGQPDLILALVIFLYAAGVSWVEERVGRFQEMSPRNKQLVNALFGFVVPALVVWTKMIVGQWPAALGTPEEFVLAVLRFLAPVAVWLATQVVHYLDLWFRRLAKGPG